MTKTLTLVLGLGNPLLGDDGVGWHIAEQVQRRIQEAPYLAEVGCLSVGGLRLMERLVGYDRVILLDAISTGQQGPGYVYCLSLEDFPDLAAGHLSSAHDTTLPTALELGTTLGVPLPTEVRIVAVEAQHIFDFMDGLTPAVAAAVPHATQRVLEILEENAYGLP